MIYNISLGFVAVFIAVKDFIGVSLLMQRSYFSLIILSTNLLNIFYNLKEEKYNIL